MLNSQYIEWHIQKPWRLVSGFPATERSAPWPYPLRLTWNDAASKATKPSAVAFLNNAALRNLEIQISNAYCLKRSVE